MSDVSNSEADKNLRVKCVCGRGGGGGFLFIVFSSSSSCLVGQP